MYNMYFSFAGDRRENEHPFLAALHTVFTRYHNYIATELKERHPTWNDETLYQVDGDFL